MIVVVAVAPEPRTSPAGMLGLSSSTVTVGASVYPEPPFVIVIAEIEPSVATVATALAPLPSPAIVIFDPHLSVNSTS